MSFEISTPLATRLSGFTEERRESSRPLEYREHDFNEKYDSDTLFYDAFWTSKGDQIVLIAPPFLNLLPKLRAMTVTALEFKAKCQFKIRIMERHAQIWVEAPSGTEMLRLQWDLGAVDVRVAPNRSAYFKDRRVLFTVSKNNPLEWILDWIRFHRDIHGADAILLYDNGFTQYDCEKLCNTIRQVSGIVQVCIVNWPFRYGVGGPAPCWDDYCQQGAMEHARWRFLTDARGVMNSDIDELVLSATGRSVFAAAERSWMGVVRYHGAWVVGIEGDSPLGTSDRAIRHKDFEVVLRPKIRRNAYGLPKDENKSAAKWTVAPYRCPRSFQWRIHSVGCYWPPGRIITSEFSHRHFRELSTNWRYDRLGYERFDSTRHRRDDSLISHFARVCWDS